MSLSLGKLPKLSHIHYSEPNQEPPEHIKAKDRIRHILYNFDYHVVTNSNDGHHEYTMPPLVTSFIAETEAERIRQYQIDLVMHNTVSQKIISIEINGAYHFKDAKSRAKMRLKEDTIIDYLSSRKELEVKNVKHLQKYPYKTFKVVSFRTEEVYGSCALDREQIIDSIFR